MNISIENKDSLNALVTINIEKDDYAKKVDKILTDYRKQRIFQALGKVKFQSV